MPKQALTGRKARKSKIAAPATERIDPRTSIPTIPSVTSPGREFTGADGESVVSPGRRYYQRLTRYNPIRNLTPTLLSRQMDDFQNGYLREFALMMDAIEHRDDVLMSVIPKRKAAVKKLKWKIMVNEDLPEELEAQAEEHHKALQYFYDNVKATSAVDADVKAGWPTFADQMMNALGHKYAVHEILWTPTPEGLSATFNYVPLWFFENRTGKLRFLPHDFAPFGDDLLPKAWLVTVGPHLMEPSAVAYMYKVLSLKDWVLYNQKHGMPGIHGQTTAAYKSDQWKALETAVAEIASDFSCVTGAGDKIERIDFSTQGQIPFEPMVERMDRALSWMWRGGSMSTTGGTSKGPEQFGAGMQEDEADSLREQDAEMLTETLNTQIDPVVIEWAFGPGVKPLAYVKIAPEKPKNAATDIQVFDFLQKYGVELGKNQLRTHFDIAPPDPEDELVQSPMERLMESGGMGEGGASPPFGGGQRPPPPGGGKEEEEDTEFAASNQRVASEVDAALLRTAREELARDTADALKPLRERLEGVLEMPNEQAMLAALRKLRKDLPDVLREINRNPANADALYKTMTAGWFNGLLNATVQHN